MNANRFMLSRAAASACLAIAGIAPYFTIGVVARTLPARPPMLYRAAPDRVLAPKLRPRHLRTLALRADRIGDTPYSSKYYKLTNITAQVGVPGSNGIAYAVNNDGRIAYTDLAQDQSAAAYIVNNGGTFGKLVAPAGVPQGTNLYAYALNENAEVVGAFQNFAIGGHIAWTVSPAGGSTVTYWDKSGIHGEEVAVNNHDIGAGTSATAPYPFGYAAVYYGRTKPAGKEIALRDLKGSDCEGNYATGINDSDEIIGSSCEGSAAIVFSRTGYAEPLPLTPKNAPSFAQAINQHGDVVGQIGYLPNGGGAFLLRNGKTIDLPLPKGYKSPGIFTGFSVNATDEVVGDICDDNYNCVGFLYKNGRTYDLNTLIPPDSGWQIVDVLGINDRGEIVGDGYYNGEQYGISLKPPI